MQAHTCAIVPMVLKHTRVAIWVKVLRQMTSEKKQLHETYMIV